MLLLLAVAHAHSPHDDAWALAATGDGLVLTDDHDVLALSEDAGETFRWRWWPGGVPDCLLLVDARRWVAASDWAGAWATEDGGLTWTAITGPERVGACTQAGGRLTLASADGAWQSETWGTWSQVAELPWPAAAVADAGEALVLKDPSGGAWRVASGEVAALDLAGVGALAADGSAVLAATAEGLWWSQDAGASWLFAGGPTDGLAVALDGETWLVATADEAAWVSEDGGASWRLEAGGLDLLAEGLGGTEEPHYPGLLVAGGEWLLAGFEGVYRWNGLRWEQGFLDGLPRVRSLAWLDDGRLVLASYGGGVYRGTPGSDDWQAVSDPVDWPWLRFLVAPDDQWILAGGGKAAYASADGGRTWTRDLAGLAYVGDVVAPAPGFPEDPRIAVAGLDHENRAAVSISEDAGASWTAQRLPADCSAKPLAMAWSGDLLWAACDSDGQLHRLDGGTWTHLATLGATAMDMAPGEPLLVATTGGLVAWEDGARVYALEGYELTSVARGPDGRVWAAAPELGLVVVDGTTDVVGDPGDGPVDVVRVSPSGVLAVGTHGGAWVSADDGASWTRASAYDRVDDRLQHWWFEGWDEVDLSRAVTGSAHRGSPGAVAELRLEGERVVLLGSASAGSRASVSVDGAAAEALAWDEAAPLPSALWSADLSSGMHTVLLEVTAGELTIDAAERWLEAPPAEAAPTPEARCGCRGDGDALLLVPLLGSWRRRRSPANQSASAHPAHRAR